ncbi:MAG: MFS transporter [Bacteroidota bacterium]
MLAIQKNLTKSFFAMLSLPATAMGFALSVQIAALSWILSTQYGLDIHDVGLVWAAGPIAGILGQVIIGIVSDKVWFWGGRRRPFILIGGVLAALMLLALPNIDVIAAAMGVEGILGVALVVALTLDLAINVSFNPTRSIIADVTPEGTARTQGYTWMQTISGTFGVLAYGIGAVYSNYVLIYAGAVLVLLFSIIPPFFVKEPRSLEWDGEDDEVGPLGTQAQPDPDVLQRDLEVSASAKSDASVGEIIRTIEPLWGFFIYAVYAMALRLTGIDVGHYYVEFGLLALTVLLIARSLMKSEAGKTKAEAGKIGFQKVLAAHAFTWVGVQTMFVYMFAYVQDTMPGLGDDEVGSVLNISFLIFNAVAAILPAFVLEPITERIGRVRTHLSCIAIMAVGYAGILFAGTTPLIIYSLMAVCGVGWAATVSLPFAIMSQKVDQARMGLYMGLFNLSVVLPQLVASLGIGEIVSQADDKSVIFVICAGSLALSAAAWLFVREGEEETTGALATAGGH